MAVKFGFYNSLNGDRLYAAEDISGMFEGMISNGVFSNVGNSFAVTYNAGTMNVSVGTGRAWFNGSWIKNDSTLLLTIEASETLLNRIDSVILEFDKSVGVRANTIKIKKGTPGSSPSAPTMTITADIQQYRIANIYVAAGVTQILSGNITGFVGTAGTPLVANITVGSFNLDTFLTQMDAEFTFWMNELVDELTAGQVTNLQAQITQLKTGWVEVGATCVYASADSPVFVMNVADAAAVPIAIGNRIKLTQTTEKYFIVVAKGTPSGGNTPITLYGGTDYTLANSAITAPYYSNSKSPLGFPINPEKWTITLTNSLSLSQANPTALSWYNVGALYMSLAIGLWRIKIKGRFDATHTGTATLGLRITLSTSNNSESESNATINTATGDTGTMTTLGFFTSHTFMKSILTKTTYYLNLMTGTAGASALMVRGDLTTTVITAECAYL